MVSFEGVTSIAYSGSIPVENVQSPASKNLIEIPPRYLREEYESDELLEWNSIDQFIAFSWHRLSLLILAESIKVRVVLIPE